MTALYAAIEKQRRSDPWAAMRWRGPSCLREVRIEDPSPVEAGTGRIRHDLTGTQGVLLTTALLGFPEWVAVGVRPDGLPELVSIHAGEWSVRLPALV